MFSFHKSDASRSRQSSIDSEAIGPTTSTAGSDIWPDQYSMSSSHVGSQSPEQHYRGYPARRSSVFNLRSRSNTGASMTPSLLSLSHPDMAEYESSGSPPGSWQLGNKSQKESTGTRRSLFRSRKGKRLSETVVTTTGVDEYEGDNNERRASILRKGRRGNNQSEDGGTNLIGRISSPFDFQHLTHTDRHHFAALEHAPGDKLAAGFYTVRASQPYTQAPATQADNFHFRNFSSENLATAGGASLSALGTRSPPGSPGTHHDSQTSTQFADSQRTLRLARSVESFSQPGVSPRKHHQTPSLASPPLLSSRLPLGPASSSSEIAMPIARRRSKRESGVWDSFSISAATTPEILPEIEEDSSYFGHAVTTPDDSAIHAMTSPFSPSLADVVEEPERFVSPRSAPQPPSRSPTSPMSPYFGSFSFHDQRSPNLTNTRVRGQSSASSTSRPSSQMSDTLGSINLTRRTSVRRPAHRRQSNTWRAIEESWEEDVDYIYDNALEADCDFEWDRASDDGAGHGQRRDVTFIHHQASSANLGSINSRTSLLVPSASNVPDLVPNSAVSFSTISTGLQTPSDSFNASHFSGDAGYVVSPSLFAPQEFKDTYEVTYEDLLMEYAGSDSHFPMLDARQSMTSSARSSHVRLSRRSSYDSSLMSSSQSWSSPIRRSASSAGSVPELVPSRRSRKESGFSLVVDQMPSQRIDSLDQGMEYDDITPPGHTLEGRTFFASDDETPQVEEQPRVSIETELRASLDLARRGSRRTNYSTVEEDLKTSLDFARQGSQRSTRRQHKQALSDGAAKLLSAPFTKEDQSPKLRNRAATTTQGRPPMLSLFPAPPRSTPTRI